MPTQASHAASYVGSPLRVNVTAPNIHAAKCQLDMNSNSYVGQLRQQIASRPAFNIPPQRLRMFLGGEPHHAMPLQSDSVTTNAWLFRRRWHLI